MVRYRSVIVGELAEQAKYAPRENRLEQIQRAESLILECESEKQYPEDFVAWRVTGFRADNPPQSVVSGRALRRDLRVFVEEVFASTRTPVHAAGEPVLTVDELSRQLRVSTKTISRWRERGLASRRFVFGSRTRVGFLKSSVDRFLAAHPVQVHRATRFSQMSDEEKDLIIRRARRMARVCPDRPSEIFRRIARKLGRSPETVRYTLKRYDRENPSHAVFSTTTGQLGETEKSAIYRAYRRGVPAEALAARYQKTKTTVYRVINEMRALRLLDQKLDYIHHPSFEEPDAAQVILGPEPTGGTIEVRELKTPKDLPPYLASLYEVPLLTKEQEIHLFRKMNYLKYRASQELAKLDSRRARATELDRVEKMLEDALAAKNQIIRANLRLVVSIAKRHVGDSNNFFELVSDGNMSLIRAVEKFDFGRGNKFSTYASWAIIKNFARSIPEELTRRDRFVTGHDDMFDAAADRRSDEHEQVSSWQQIRGAIASILDRLDERERTVIVSRFGLRENAEPQTLEEVGNELGVTKERIRQLEARALGKLRRFAAEAGIDLPD